MTHTLIESWTSSRANKVLYRFVDLAILFALTWFALFLRDISPLWFPWIGVMVGTTYFVGWTRGSGLKTSGRK